MAPAPETILPLPATVPAPPGGPAAPPLARPYRPRWISAVGVCSILFGCLGALWALFLTGEAVLLVTFTPIAIVTPAPPRVPRGLGPAQRRPLVETLAARRSLSDERTRQLEAILATAGRDMGADQMGESGAMPAPRPDAADCDYFVTVSGRLEVYNDHAVFLPADGSPAVRVSAAETDTSGSASDASASNALSPSQVAAVVAAAQTSTSKALNPAQLNALSSALSAVDQQLVSPGRAATAFVYAAARPGGTAIIQLDGGTIAIDVSGRVLSQFAAAAPGATSAVGSAAGAFGSIAPVLATVSLLLALWLLFLGIATLGDSPKARRLHLAYVTVKLPVVVIAAYCFERTYQALAAESSSPGVINPHMIGGQILIGASYPIALLALLNLKPVKAYYARARVGGAPRTTTPRARTAMLVVALAIGSVALGIGAMVGFPLLVRIILRSPRPTAAQRAAFQAQQAMEELAVEHPAYLSLEHPAGTRGEHFYATTLYLDQFGRGGLREQHIVQWLGPPDGVVGNAAAKDLVYYYDNGSGARDSVVIAELQNNVLKNFGYTGASQMPRSRLSPYVPTTIPTPATSPAGTARPGP